MPISSFNTCRHLTTMVAFWRSTEDFSTPKFLTIGPRQRYNLKMSVRELLYYAIFCACPVNLPHRFPKRYYSSQSEVVLKLGLGLKAKDQPTEHCLVQFSKYDSNHFNQFPDIPQKSSLDRRMLWSTGSKAFFRSRKITPLIF